jgi:DNA-binding FadR family transcriptional regulator
VLLAAERGNEQVFARMDALIAEMDARPDFEAYRRADVRWHIALAEAAGTRAWSRR